MSELRTALQKWYIALPFFASFAFLYLFCAACAGCELTALLGAVPFPVSAGLFLVLFALPPGFLFLSTYRASGERRAVHRRLHGLSSAVLTSYLYLLLCIFLCGAVCVFAVLSGALPLSRETVLLFSAAQWGMFLLIHLVGFLNAQFPRVRRISCVLGRKSGRESGGKSKRKSVRTGENRFLPANAPVGEPPDLRAALISDLHFGYFTDLRFFRRVFRKIKRESPDLLLIAGDFFDYSFDDLPPRKREVLRDEFLELKKALPYGIFFCEGNHDVIAGAGDPRPGKFIEECGIRVLADEIFPLSFKNAKGEEKKLYLAGRRDLFHGENDDAEPACPLDGSTGGPSDGSKNLSREDPRRKSPRALLRSLPKDAPLLLLDHRPKQIPALAEAGADLVLCGHVHNGQSFPGNLLHRILSRYAYGKAVTGEPPCLSYTTSGCGRWAIPLRLFTSDEIAFFDLLIP